VSTIRSVARKTIPLCGIVLILGTLGCGNTGFYVFRTRSSQTNAGVARSQQQLIDVVQSFLRDVPKNERSTFDRFFADEIIYTRGTGQVVTKKDILAEVGKESVPASNATFTGEDFNVHQYGDMAVVNFRLVMHAIENDKPVTRTLRNTGTFMKRNGQWQAIAWQATPIEEKQ
jgi:hypothetical protein